MNEIKFFWTFNFFLQFYNRLYSPLPPRSLLCPLFRSTAWRMSRDQTSPPLSIPLADGICRTIAEGNFLLLRFERESEERIGVDSFNNSRKAVTVAETVCCYFICIFSFSCHADGFYILFFIHAFFFSGIVSFY